MEKSAINSSKSILAILYLVLMCIPVFSVNAESSKLDVLFLQLKNASNEAEARTLEDQIWKSWLETGDANIDDMMQDSLRARSEHDYNGALQILNKVIALKPDYAEAWNQRATIYFLQQEYEKSLRDIAKTLELEPRHFGSIAGRAMIRLKQEKPELARQNIAEAIKFHPYLRERRLFPGL